MRLINRSRHPALFDLASSSWIDADRIPCILKERISARDFASYLASAHSQAELLPIAGFVPIPARTIWDARSDKIRYVSTIGLSAPHRRARTPELLKCVRRYLGLGRDDRIAVELSGGLDTTVVVSFLRALGHDPVLVGLESDRYEFRTEREIQRIYAEGGARVSLISQRSVTAFGGLTKVPRHNFPDPASLYYLRHVQIATRAIELGASTVLTGDTGDNLLALDVSTSGMELIRSYDRWGLSNAWVDEFVYRTLGAHCVSAFSLQEIARLLLGMRKTCSSDPMKLWARAAWSELLPPKLSRFAYKASHDNWIVESLRLAAEEIAYVAASAHSVLAIDDLDPGNLVDLSTQYACLESRMQHRFLETLAFATWLHGHVRDGLF